MTFRGRAAPLLIGHRGAPGYRPEHTESSYRLAFAQGVDAVEPDLVVSRDGVLVIRHENEISATTDVAAHACFADRRTVKTVDGTLMHGWFAEDFTWAELSTLRCRERLPALRPSNVSYDGTEPMLRLADLIALLRETNAHRERKIGLVIELKHVHFLRQQGHDLVTLLMDELALSGWNDERDAQLMIECFELGALDRLRELQMQARFIFLMHHQGAPADEVAVYGDAASDYAWYRTDRGLDALVGRVHGVSLSKREILRSARPVEPGSFTRSQHIVDRAQARGLLVFTWTMRPENSFLSPEFRGSSNAAEWGRWQEEWKRILDTGLDGVFLDHPKLFAEL